MKVVKETKIPTIKQMNSMASNLRTKLNCHVQIELLIDAYDHLPPDKDAKVRYQIYTAKECNGEKVRTFDSWKELQDYYKKLISS